MGLKTGFCVYMDEKPRSGLGGGDKMVQQIGLKFWWLF